MDKKLKPCPFCGADEESGVHIDTIVIADDIGDIRRYSVVCENCGAEIGTFRSPEEAVEAWNKRVVKHGVWVHHSDNLECSECGYNACCNENSNYCPACGARMDKKE